MTNTEKLALMENRLAKLKGSPKCAKAPGVMKALERKIKNMRKKVENE